MFMDKFARMFGLGEVAVSELKTAPISVEDVAFFDEEWRTIEHSPGYMVSSRGRVWSNRSKIVLKQGTTSSDHQIVCLGTPGNAHYVHALVCEAWHGPRPDGMVCCHNDGDPTNNTPENVRWDTWHSNVLDRSKHAKSFRKLTADDVREIRAMDIKRGDVKVLAERLNVSRATIHSVLRKRSHKRVK